MKPTVFPARYSKLERAIKIVENGNIGNIQYTNNAIYVDVTSLYDETLVHDVCLCYKDSKLKSGCTCKWFVSKLDECSHMMAARIAVNSDLIK